MMHMQCISSLSAFSSVRISSPSSTCTTHYLTTTDHCHYLEVSDHHSVELLMQHQSSCCFGVLLSLPVDIFNLVSLPGRKIITVDGIAVASPTIKSLATNVQSLGIHCMFLRFLYDLQTWTVPKFTHVLGFAQQGTKDWC
jgi:hypothetical protein